MTDRAIRVSMEASPVIVHALTECPKQMQSDLREGRYLVISSSPDIYPLQMTEKDFLRDFVWLAPEDPTKFVDVLEVL
jgi:hypothetical protein